MKLYQLTEDYQRLLDAAALTDNEDDRMAFQDTLEGIAGEIHQKIIGCAGVVRTLEAHAEMVKAEADRLSKKSKALEANAESLRKYMQGAMDVSGLAKVDGDLFTVSIQQNNPKVLIDAEELIPQVYKRVETVTSISKKEILDALKAGREIPGARMERGKSLRIK